MAISSPGLGSNLDVNSIVSQLMALEKRPLTELAKKEAGLQAKISALGSLQGAISALQTAAGNLVPASGTTATQKFSVFKSAVSDATIASASTSSSAVAGTYSLEVTQLAKQHSIATSTTATPFSGTDGTLPTGGTLTLSLDTVPAGTSPTKTTDITLADGATPEQVRDAINNASAGVSAVVINGVAGKQLVLTGDTAGSNQFIRLSGIAGLAYNPNDAPAPTDAFVQSQAAQGSSFKLNGIAVTAATNTVTTALDGVTLTLLKGPEAPATSLSTTLTISKDNSSLTSGLNALVKALNEFNTTANSLGSYNPTTKVAGALNGDSTLRTAQSSVRNSLGEIPSALSGATLQRLSDVGVSLQKDGKWTVDSSKLTKAISENFSGVANLVAAYSAKLKSAADGLVGTDGLIAARSAGLNTSIKSLDKQSDVISSRLTQIEARYRRQFTALDTLVSGMTTTSNFLTQQLANLPTYE
ncbi:flagellar filament capping protein FliD [Accumulibacter sp.]|uniref:flagellar filament capping protein FliD n=1 Tax=Accumulibacter sp. TaxID=2053492 RepID=UPI002609D982|nr:flagellar filament capping protein FliD [Accumulibacter sp.]